MTIKDNVDFSLFTGFNNFDLFSNSIRRSFSYDAYGDKNIFQAVVISQPIPLDPNDSKYFSGKETPRSNKISRFSYRGRIIGSDSPHKFLPDPCNPIYTGEVSATNEIIALHTTFYSSGEVGEVEVLPRIGSLVEVRLEKNAYSYDLSRGVHIKVTKNPSDPSAKTDSCDSIRSIMQSAAATPAWSYDDGENLGGPPLDDPKIEEIYNAYITKYGSNLAPPDGMCGNLPGYPLQKCKVGKIGTRTCTLHPKFFDKVKEMHDLVVSQKFDKTNPTEKINGGGTIRTVKKQISLRIKNAKKKGSVLNTQQYISERSSVCKPPTAPLPTAPGKGSRHIYGCAIDFGGILLHGGTDAAELPDSVARKSKIYKFLLSKEESGFKNYRAEPWHWRIDGR